MHHEHIHIRQQLEGLLVVFYVVYVLEFFIHFIRYRNIEEAYRRISFEREAYANEDNFNYLSQRKFWAWIRYL